MILLKNTEITICLIIWTSLVLYSMYSFIHQSSKFFRTLYHDDYNDFQEGYLFGNRKDVADLEWQTMLYLYKKIWKWILVMLIASEYFRRRRQFFRLKQFQVIISIIFILKYLGAVPLFSILLQPLMYFLISKATNKFGFLWLANLIIILTVSYYKSLISSDFLRSKLKLNEQENYLHILAIFWINLRCFSFCNESKNKNYLDLLSFTLYLPFLFNGPFIFYTDFVKSQDDQLKFSKRISQFVKDLLRFIFWMIFVEISLHFVYVNATAYQIELVESLDYWSLYGYGYTMGQYFHLKYLVVYGLSTSVCKFEGISVPSLPKCIGRIHLYSDMWKYFDNGLYKFLLKYIYLPSLELLNLNKSFASLFCFIFVFIWHGIDGYIFVWVALNYFGIVVESFSFHMYNNYLKKLEIVKFSGDAMVQRITCFLASFLLVVSAISNFYFFAGIEIGTIFVSRTLEANWKSFSVLIMALYCCCQFSTELRIDNKNMNKNII